jgi:hypothetical protein
MSSEQIQITSLPKILSSIEAGAKWASLSIDEYKITCKDPDEAPEVWIKVSAWETPEDQKD